MKTTTNTGKNQKKFIRNANRKCGSHLNHKLFSENFNYDPLDVFSKPTISIRTMSLDFKRNQTEKKNPSFFLMKTRVIEVKKHIVSR